MEPSLKSSFRKPKKKKERINHPPTGPTKSLEYGFSIITLLIILLLTFLFVRLPAANVVILGAGTVGEYACRTALGLGASVIVFDNSVSKSLMNEFSYNSTMQIPRIIKIILSRQNYLVLFDKFSDIYNSISHSS